MAHPRACASPVSKRGRFCEHSDVIIAIDRHPLRPKERDSFSSDATIAPPAG
jgi:hypothetical protein